MIDIRARLQAIKDTPATLGMVKSSDIAAQVDELFLDMDIEAAAERCDYETVVAIQNQRLAA